MFQTNFPALNQHMHGFLLGVECTIFMPPFDEKGAYWLANVGRSVCRSVGRSVGRPNGFPL